MSNIPTGPCNGSLLKSAALELEDSDLEEANVGMGWPARVHPTGALIRMKFLEYEAKIVIERLVQR